MAGPVLAAVAFRPGRGLRLEIAAMTRFDNCVKTGSGYPQPADLIPA